MPPSPEGARGAALRRAGRPRRDQQLRQKLMASALELFGARGFEGTSLSQIARAAGTDIALIRYYFGSKEGLWRSAIEDLAQQLRDELRPVLAESSDATAATQLRRVIRWFVDMSARHPWVSRIIVHEGNDGGERGRFVAEQMVEPFFATMSDVIERAKREGMVPEVSTRTIFFMITHGGSFPMAMPELTNALPGGNILSASGLRRHADALSALVIHHEAQET